MTKQNKETIFTELIERTLAKMPSDFDAWVRKKIVFVFPKEKELARAIPKKESKHYEAMIILHDELLSQEEWYQEHSLLHEIAHVKLKHTKQSDAEKERKQENEAHALALKWLSEERIEESRKKMASDRNLKSSQQQKAFSFPFDVEKER